MASQKERTPLGGMDEKDKENKHPMRSRSASIAFGENELVPSKLQKQLETELEGSGPNSKTMGKLILEMASELIKVKNLVNTREKALLSLNDSLEKAVNEVDSSRKAITHLRVNLKAREKEGGELKSELDSLQKDIKDQKVKVTNQEKELTSLKKENSEQKGTIENQAKKIADLEKSGASNKIDEKLDARISSIESAFQESTVKLEKKIINEIQTNDKIVKAVAKIAPVKAGEDTGDLKKIQDDLEKVRKEMKAAKSTIASVKSDKRKKEIENAKYGIILTGVPYHVNKKGNKETDVQTKQVCYSLLQELNLCDYVEIYSALRYNAKADDNRPTVIKLEVASLDQKTWVFQYFMRAVMNGNDRRQGITLADYVPKCLQEDKKVLGTKAYELRKASKAFRPRIILGDDGVLIKVFIMEKKKFHFYGIEDVDKIDELISKVKDADGPKSGNAASAKNATAKANSSNTTAKNGPSKNS